MGFRAGSYATVWEVFPDRSTSTRTKVRLAISRKNKNTGEYEQDFGGFVEFVGTAAAAKALKLQPKDRIKLGDVDVSNRFDRETKREFTDFKVFSFEMADENGGGSHAAAYEGEPAEPEEAESSDDLPF